MHRSYYRRGLLYGVGKGKYYSHRVTVANTFADLKTDQYHSSRLGIVRSAFPLLLKSGETSQRIESDVLNYQC